MDALIIMVLAFAGYIIIKNYIDTNPSSFQKISNNNIGADV